MIGGTDVVIPSSGDAAALESAARIIHQFWPHARFEDAVTGDKYDHYGQIPFRRVRELLVYRDAQAEAAWDAEDANSPPNSMVYFILGRDSITVVMDDPDAVGMMSILGSLRASQEPAIQPSDVSGS